jgi:hypothetical protein
MARARKADVAAAQMGPSAELDDEEDVRRRIASGELVRHVSHGAPPVRDHIVAQLRAQVSAPKPHPKKEPR